LEARLDRPIRISPRVEAGPQRNAAGRSEVRFSLRSSTIRWRLKGDHPDIPHILEAARKAPPKARGASRGASKGAAFDRPRKSRFDRPRVQRQDRASWLSAALAANIAVAVLVVGRKVARYRQLTD